MSYANYYRYLTEEQLIEKYEDYKNTKDIFHEMRSLEMDINYALKNYNLFWVNYSKDEYMSTGEYLSNIGIRLTYLSKLYDVYREEEQKTAKEVNEEYYKMLAFRSEFTNGFEYTEEELKYYRERFNDYYEFKGERK